MKIFSKTVAEGNNLPIYECASHSKREKIFPAMLSVVIAFRIIPKERINPFQTEKYKLFLFFFEVYSEVKFQH